MRQEIRYVIKNFRQINIIQYSQKSAQIHNFLIYTKPIYFVFLASSGSLHNHRRSVHEEQKRFECHVCFKQFALKQKLVNHVLSEHER